MWNINKSISLVFYYRYLHILILLINCDVCRNTHLKPLCLVKRTRLSLSLFYYVQVLLNAVRSLKSLQKRLLNAVTSLCSLYASTVQCCHFFLWSLSASTAQCCQFPISTMCKHCSILSHLCLHCTITALACHNTQHTDISKVSHSCHNIHIDI